LVLDQDDRRRKDLHDCLSRHVDLVKQFNDYFPFEKHYADSSRSSQR